MVKKYVILANSNDTRCDIPRQLIEINGETLCGRTVRLLKENGIDDIIISARDKRFDNLGAKRYEPLKSFDYINHKGYLIDMYPLELLTEPICFLMGDVYFSENAIKTIVETDTDSTLFFCSYENKCKEYLKKWDEPFAYKVVDIDLFKKHIEIVKKLYDEKATWRNPISWELYRSINGQNVNVHSMTKNYVAINDESCDIDYKEEIEKLKLRIEKNFTKKLTLVISYYETYELTEKLLDRLVPQLTNDVEVILIDDGCNEKRLDKFNKKIDIIHLEENKGGAYASNIGIIKSKGKYVGFIDSDDMIAEDYIATLVETIDNRDEDIIFFDWQDMNTGAIVRHPNNYAPWKAIYRRQIIPLFPAGRLYSYDVPFYDEIQERNYSKYYINKVLYLYNSGRIGSLTWEKAKKIKEESL